MKCASAAKSPARQAQRTSKNIRGSRKSVRFFESGNKVVFRHLLKEELKHAWYQSDEYKEFQKDRITTISTLRSAKGDLNALDPSKHCVRGLEMNATPEIFRYRTVGIKVHARIVLQQQKLQRQVGHKDDGTLGIVSTASSKAAIQLAAALALIDSQNF